MFHLKPCAPGVPQQSLVLSKTIQIPSLRRSLGITELDQCKGQDQLSNPVKEKCNTTLISPTRDLQNLNSNILPDLRASDIVELVFAYPHNSQIRCGYMNMWVQGDVLRKISRHRIDFMKIIN